MSPSVEKTSTRDVSSNPMAALRSAYSSMVMMAARAPKGAAPDSPEVMGASPLMGAASMRMPWAAAQSGREMNTLTWFFRISQEMVLGSPQASPAMMVSMSPPTVRDVPVSRLGTLVQAVGGLGLHHHEYWRIIRI